MDRPYRTLKRAALALALAALPAGLAAQGGGAWNDPRALDLIRRAAEQRATTQSDTGMVDYQAQARGYVYFYLDRRDTNERTLVKTDQVALDVFWKAPAMSKQRIVGLRDEKKLPTTIHYHKDHLTVVQDNFGDLIRLGDGDEVRDVLHPAAPGADRTYDFRIADSTAIRMPGAAEKVEVYEVQVRPKDTSRPALVGSVFVDRRQGAIVRMSFTFTAASYVDRQLDYINVLLENGLWKGRFWLPDHQEVEIRRQLPELGFPAGGVIRGTMRVSGYRFNQNLPAAMFAGPRVEEVPEARARAFPFEQPLYAELRDQGLSPEVELGEIRRQAAEIARERLLSGLPAARLDVPSVSSIFRYDRAEGPTVGFGTVLHPREQVEVRLNGGWAFGPEHPVATAQGVWTKPSFRLEGDAYANLPRDLQPGPNASGAMNTLTALLAGRDYTDLYYASGAELSGTRGAFGAWKGTLSVRVEDQASASREATTSAFGGSGHFRPVLPIDDGTMVRGALTLSRAAASGVAHGLSASVTAAGGRLAADQGPALSFFRPTAELGYVRRWTARDAGLDARLSGGAGLGDVPSQELFLLGGRGTVPGFDYRSFGGRAFGLLRATASAEVMKPWIRGRLHAAAGWAGDAPPVLVEPPVVDGANVLPVADPFRADLGFGSLAPLRTTLRPRVSVGAGVGLVYDILRLDVHHGIGPDSRWELVIEANPTFWDFL